MGRGAWQATVHGATKSWTRLSEVPLLVINDADIPISLCQLRQGQDWQVFFLLSSEGQGFRYYSLSRLNLYLNLISQLEWVQSFFPFPQITAL